MNKYKIIICILFSMFLVGCEATYDVNINGNIITENVEFVEKDTTKYDEILFSHTDITYKSSIYENANWPTGAFYLQNGNPYEPIKMDGVEYYNQSLIDDNTGLGIKYDYIFNLDNYINSNAVKSCFKNFSFGNGDKIISLYANNASYCFNGRKMLDKVSVNLTTTYPVISHNADKYNSNTNTYTWNITTKNSNTKIIKMELSKDLNYKPEKKEEKNVLEKGSTNVLLIAFGIFILIGGIIGIVIYTKNKNINKV